MQKLLHWKKTIGILSIILGALRFLSGAHTYSQLNALETLDSILTLDTQKYLICIKFILPIEIIAMGAVFTLGIILLCADRGLTTAMSRPKSRKLALTIYIITAVYIFLEIFVFVILKHQFNYSFSFFALIAAFGLDIALFIFCTLGLTPKTAQNSKPLPINKTDNQPQKTELDNEIAELKKKIEKLKLEQELHELNEKQEN